MSESDFRDYYEILEIPVDAPHHEIVKAYQRAKEAYDMNSPALYTMFTKEEAAELRALIDEAFQVLGNQAKRKEYDQEMRGQSDAPAIDQLNVINERKNKSADEKPAVQNEDPANVKRNRFGTYKLNAQFESELKERNDFDGAFLKKVRTYQNISVEQLSKETRISRTYITAVEADDLSSLPAPVFVRGFIVQLARALGLDENKVANSYMSRYPKA